MLPGSNVLQRHRGARNSLTAKMCQANKTLEKKYHDHEASNVTSVYCSLIKSSSPHCYISPKFYAHLVLTASCIPLT